jgi:hypothetical protein
VGAAASSVASADSSAVGSMAVVVDTADRAAIEVNTACWAVEVDTGCSVAIALGAAIVVIAHEGVEAVPSLDSEDTSLAAVLMVEAMAVVALADCS